MKKIAIIIFSVFFYFITVSDKTYSHSGRTGPSGCHMDYNRIGGAYHCHKQKTINPYQTYYYVHHRGQVIGPYKSYGSCMNAVRGARLTGAYCSTSRY